MAMSASVVDGSDYCIVVATAAVVAGEQENVVRDWRWCWTE